MKLSVIMPALNEEPTVAEAVRRVLAAPYDIEIIFVDDGSTDRTAEIAAATGGDRLKLIRHQSNRGKGAAVRTAVEHVTGDVALIQDADLEYDPADYPLLIGPILEGRADVVYGSRFLGPHRVSLYTHYIGNRVLSMMTSLLYGRLVTDMETCYKAMRGDIIRKLCLRSDSFDIEPEITARVIRLGYRFMEVPVHYYGRDFDHGKKIKWVDGFRAVWALVKYRFAGMGERA